MGDSDNKLQFGNSLNNASMLKMDRPTTASSGPQMPPTTAIPASVVPQTPAVRPSRNPPPVNRAARAFNPFSGGTFNSVNGAYPYSPMSSSYSPLSSSYSPLSSSYSSMFDSTGFGGYNRYGMSPYGMYGGGGFGQYGFESRFAQLAEESALPAFQSVESFVRSFTSVTMMMENTYQAMVMSFRAVLRVTESVSQLKKVLVDMMAALSVFKLFLWFMKRIKYFLGLVRGRPVESLAESTWESLAQDSLVTRTSSSPSSWPLITFLGLMFGGPYLVHKLMSSPAPPPEPSPPTKPSSSSSGSWTPATARYDFDTTGPGELTIRRGDRLLVSTNDLKSNANNPNARLQPSWVLAINAMTKQQGYVPSDRLAFSTQ